MGSVYYGQTTFGDQDAEGTLGNTIVAPPASASASFLAPSFGDKVIVAVPASASASSPTPSVAIALQIASPTFGGMTFGGSSEGALDKTVGAVPASASAFFPIPSVHGNPVLNAPPASASAAALAPLPSLVLAAPPVSASAAFLLPSRLGMAVSRAPDMPTSLVLRDPARRLELERETTLEIEREIELALWELERALELFGHTTTLALHEPRSLELAAYTTTLELDPGETILEPDENVRELVLDG